LNKWLTYGKQNGDVVGNGCVKDVEGNVVVKKKIWKAYEAFICDMHSLSHLA